MSDLVGNPEDRFSHNKAHFILFLYPKFENSSSSQFHVQGSHFLEIYLKSIDLDCVMKLELGCHFDKSDKIRQDNFTQLPVKLTNCLFNRSSNLIQIEIHESQRNLLKI